MQTKLEVRKSNKKISIEKTNNQIQFTFFSLNLIMNSSYRDKSNLFDRNYLLFNYIEVICFYIIGSINCYNRNSIGYLWILFGLMFNIINGYNFLFAKYGKNKYLFMF